MAKQTINVGTGEFAGDGESIRSAFQKANSNFDELYASAALSGPSGPSGPAGTTGTSGTSAFVFVGVTTSTTGTAIVTNTGTSSTAYLNFTIPIGPTGPSGPSGPPGNPGSGFSATFVTVSGATTSLSSGTTGTITMTGVDVGKAYVLYKLQTSYPAWIRLYTNAANRSADVNRNISVDPASNSGVIVEVISTVSGTTVIAPGVNGFNDDPGGPTNTMHFNVTNIGDNTATITVTATTVILVQ